MKLRRVFAKQPLHYLDEVAGGIVEHDVSRGTEKSQPFRLDSPSALPLVGGHDDAAEQHLGPYVFEIQVGVGRSEQGDSAPQQYRSIVKTP